MYKYYVEISLRVGQVSLLETVLTHSVKNSGEIEANRVHKGVTATEFKFNSPVDAGNFISSLLNLGIDIETAFRDKDEDDT